MIYTEDFALVYKTHSDLSICVLRYHPKCTYDFCAQNVKSENEEDSELPSDLSENELLDMITECMAIKLLKDKDT